MLYHGGYMLLKHEYDGYFLAIDGPNGVGKTTIIAELQKRFEELGISTYTTSEPTHTRLGAFTRSFAENHSGIGLACLVAADRYEHLECEIIPELTAGKVVITD